jgi:hypothetical protein
MVSNGPLPGSTGNKNSNTFKRHWIERKERNNQKFGQDRFPHFFKKKQAHVEMGDDRAGKAILP